MKTVFVLSQCKIDDIKAFSSSRQSCLCYLKVLLDEKFRSHLSLAISVQSSVSWNFSGDWHFLPINCDEGTEPENVLRSGVWLICQWGLIPGRLENSQDIFELGNYISSLFFFFPHTVWLFIPVLISNICCQCFLWIYWLKYIF